MLKKARSCRPTTIPPTAIVAIGTSADGLDALEQFFGNQPATTELAFVVILHLDPTHEARLALLGRSSRMPVTEATDRALVQRGHVYIIPPNRDLSILRGVLHLLEPSAPRGLRLPVDFFLRSLADDQHRRAIGVILSGTGSDGALGVRAIKERGGAVFVQVPGSAQFDGMPRSAVATGVCDVVAPVAELPGRIAAYLGGQTTPPAGGDDQDTLDKIMLHLRQHTGHDFSMYKRSAVLRRIERRKGLHQLTSTRDYLQYLRTDAKESHALFQELLISVTSFFRDPATWEQLERELRPVLEERHDHSGVRAWVAGCATGEEAYSLAVVVRAAAEALSPPRALSLQIFATDLDPEALERARTGLYPSNIVADVSSQRLGRYFDEEPGGWRVRKSIRDQIVFAPHDLLLDPPFTRLDVITCRNVLIYLDPAMQRRLLALFHYCLNPGGFLVLGSAETVGNATDWFGAVAPQTRVFRRVERPCGPRPADLPDLYQRGRPPASEGTPSFREDGRNQVAAMDRLVLRHYSPGAVLVGEKGDILCVSGRTGRYLEPAAGRASMNLLAMARVGLDTTLPEAFRHALATRSIVRRANVRVQTDAGEQLVDVTVHPLAEPFGPDKTALVVFADVAAGRPKAPPRGHRRTTVQLELERALAEAQATRAEMQTWQEESRATNEELQSTNEELQSIKEELTTSKGELQSMNEELQTVNHELQAKVEALSQASSDIQNLLNGTEMATLFLDGTLRVRWYSNLATRIMPLRATDAGRTITDITSSLVYPNLAEDARAVLASLVFREVTVPGREGRWFTVRIVPYKDVDQKIDGVVITFLDVTRVRGLEAELAALRAQVGQPGTGESR